MKRALTSGMMVVAILTALGIGLGSESLQLATDVTRVLQPPDADHWLGTDSLGRDVAMRTLQGYGFSLVLAVMAAAIAGVLGVAVGAWAGWMGGRVDLIAMRFIEILEAIPDLLLTVVLGLVLGLVLPGHLLTLSLALGLSGWFEVARQARVLTLRERQMLYADAAVALGAGRSRVLFKHLWPNIQDSIWILLVLQVPGFILAEAALSFFGFGVQPPIPSLGQVFVEGWRVLSVSSHVLWGPTALLFVTLIGFRAFTWGRRARA